MKETVLRTIQEYAMLSPGDRVIACVSGGADSMALLHFLASQQEKLGLGALFACHFNHGLRGESSDADEALVRAFCEQLGVELFCEHGHMAERERPKGESEESWARALRYHYFETLAEEKNALLAVAHNKNDLAETVLFNLARGAGIKGARGIPPVRGPIIRPLLWVSREQIEAYCHDSQIAYAEDETNQSDRYSRNRIRHRVLPELALVNSAAVDNLARFASYSGRVSEWLESRARERMEDSALSRDSYSVERLTAEGELCTRQALKLLLEDRGVDAGETSVALGFQVLEGSLRELQLGPGFYLRREGDRLLFRRDPEAVPSPPPVTLRQGSNPFGSYILHARFLSLPLSNGDEKSLKNILNNSIDCDKIVGTIVIRGRKEGDLFCSGRRRNTKTLKKLFQEMRIPPEKRALVPVVCDGEGVLWIPGQGTAARAACDKRSNNIIHLTLEGEL